MWSLAEEQRQAELCNDVDNNCDLSIDEYLDCDGDGFTVENGDCDDDSATAFPFGPEGYFCSDGIDNDCDGLVDLNDPINCPTLPFTLTDCDPTYCVLTVAGGPNGGDLCQCTIPGADHVQLTDVHNGSCFSGSGYDVELNIEYDLSAAGYGSYAIDTCATQPRPKKLFWRAKVRSTNWSTSTKLPGARSSRSEPPC